MPAVAGAVAHAEPLSLVAFLLALVGILIGAKVLGEVAQRLGQPPVLGEILAGLILGPYALGIVLSLSALLIIANTIRLAIYSRSDELEILGQRCSDESPWRGVSIYAPSVAGPGILPVDPAHARKAGVPCTRGRVVGLVAIYSLGNRGGFSELFDRNLAGPIEVNSDDHIVILSSNVLRCLGVGR